MKLQILIPQYKETDDILKPMLDSIAIQQNVDFKEIGVIIVNDGSNVRLSESFLESYPFEIQYHIAEHQGVSATRNACLDYATADYVMFCDADDMFFNACGLFMILAEIDNDGFDTFVSEFVEETRIDDKPVYVKHETDSTFVHGKVHRRAYLLDNNIRWNPNLTIHEDSYFNILCQTLSTTPIRYCPVSFYLWKWRDDSVCRHDPKYILKTYNNMLDSSLALVEELLKRDKFDDAKRTATSMIYDAYYTLNKDEWINQENQEYRHAVEKRFHDYYQEVKPLYDEIDEKEKNGIIVGLKNRMFDEGLFLEKITFDDWIKQFEQNGGFE